MLLKEDLPLVSVVTVNYNHANDTIEFLDSLFEITYPNLEVIVVDNGSEPQDPILINERFKGKIELFCIKNNIGFAPANNIGIQKSTGDYILSINNDMTVEKDFLEPLLKVLLSNPEIGIVSPKIYFYAPPRNIQSAGYTEINPFTIRNNSIGYNEPEKGQYERDTFSAFAHGGATMFPRKVLEDVGLMSEYFFLYYEDMDWCKRVRYAGYKICYVHNSKVYHKDSVTTGTNSPYKTYYVNRGRLIYMRRHVKFPLNILSLSYLFTVALAKNVVFAMAKKEFKQAYAVLRAYGWFIRHFFDKEMRKERVSK